MGSVMKKVCLFPLMAGVLVGGLALFSASGPRGEKPGGKGAPDSTGTDRSPTKGVGDAQEVEAFFDELIPRQLEERHIPGATVAVVSAGRPLFAKGYGWADVEQRVPVAADRSLFHIGSNTKLFTWTALMQLVEEGKLDLDADVNTSLDFRIPDTYPQPITLRHLMTHTAGFENRDIGMLAPSPETVVPIGQWLAIHIPARVRPPGVEIGYSNYGTALAGYIIERVSGMSYEQYVEQRLLEPLGMLRSTPRRQLPPNLALDAARGYVLKKGEFREQPLPTYQVASAGSIRATATDIAHFMTAHLQDGRYGEGLILRPETTRQMHQTLFKPDPQLNGFAHGFFEMDRNGVRIIGHIGSAVPLYYSVLALLPDKRTGLFVAYNGSEALPLTFENETLAAFVERFFPAPAAASLVPPPGFTGRADQYTGEYQANTFGGSYTTVEKGRRIVGVGNRRITNPGDGTLEVSVLGRGKHFVQVTPDFFREAGGQDKLLFRRGPRGRVTKAIFSEIPEYTYERLEWWERPAFNQALLGACSAVFGTTLVVAAASQVFGRLRRAGAVQEGFGRIARWTAVGMAVVDLGFVAGLFAVFGDPTLYAGRLGRMRTLLMLPLLGTVLTSWVLVCAVLAWWRGLWSLPARLHYTAAALAGLALKWFQATWNLLGFRL
jgi:CubicO group peptidase (beta-lactamase class C family)